ncbi:hypothetical protein AVEN_84916-1 [Araneus ventricosus]|uniref:Fibrinogen C-terminal domain-containing protein n=1 Tax=Araneus ventricosus TaxID=182803 RepID=A0A4Y2RNX6_ARAVE|nr:hypothetical protein AVEN_77768-1 [Araneus ventricosus]GBN77056.1 hypothetical protein AVEN_84916-1 [Araneus ventricosus]
MKTFFCFSAFFLLIFTDICSAAATKAFPPILQAAKEGDCSKCPKHGKPMDCAELLENGVTESGVHTVYPRSRLSTCKSIDVYCDMETDGGGWTEEAKTNEEAAHSTDWKYERKTSAPELGSLPEDLMYVSGWISF